MKVLFIEKISRYRSLEKLKKNCLLQDKIIKTKKNDILQGLVKIIMNSLCEVQIHRDIDESFYCKLETWMKTEFDENVLDYWRLPNGSHFVEMEKDDQLDKDCDTENTLTAVPGAYILSISKRNMNNFIREKNEFYNSSI